MMDNEFTPMRQQIKRLRKARRLTLAQVAASINMSTGYMSDIERGRTLPSLPTLAKLARLYGIQITKLLEFTNV